MSPFIDRRKALAIIAKADRDCEAARICNADLRDAVGVKRTMLHQMCIYQEVTTTRRNDDGSLSSSMERERIPIYQEPLRRPDRITNPAVWRGDSPAILAAAQFLEQSVESLERATREEIEALGFNALAVQDYIDACLHVERQMRLRDEAANRVKATLRLKENVEAYLKGIK